MISFVATFLVVQTRTQRPDVILGSTVHPFAALGAWVTSKARRVPFLFEVRDLWPQTLVDLGAVREGSLGERLLRAIEALLVKRADAVITLLPGMTAYLDERRLPSNHVVYLPNGVDLEVFDGATVEGIGESDALRSCLAAIEATRRDGRLVFAYVGSFGRVNDVPTIIEAAGIAESLAPGRIGVVLIGDGPERSHLSSLAANVSSVRMTVSVPKSSIPRVLASIDVGIVHATANPVYRYGISFNKLFEYMAARRPVVFACESAYDPIAKVGAGVSLPPNDARSLADSFLRLVDASQAEREAMGAAGRAWVEQEHDIEMLATSLATLVSASMTHSVSPSEL